MVTLKSLFALLSLIGMAAAAPMPVPPVPSGGVGVSPSDPPPTYVAMTDFDRASFNLGLTQEWIEYDLFNYGVSRFTVEEFAEQGLGPDDISLIQFMAQQEIGHAALIQNQILQGQGSKPCTYKYDFETVAEFVDFSQKLTRWGESGVLGFLQHLEARDAGTLLTQSIAVESRQQMVLRQMSGAHPMPVWHEPAITQSMQWTMLAPYIVSCPAENPRIEWQNFPCLKVTNNPSLLQLGNKAAISHNETALTFPGFKLDLEFDAPGKTVGPDGQYNTTVGANVTDMSPKFLAFISQLDVVYVPLSDVTNNSASAVQPAGKVLDVFNSTMNGSNYTGPPPDFPAINGTSFVVLTDSDLFVTPYNLSLLNDHIIAGPAIFQSG